MKTFDRENRGRHRGSRGFSMMEALAVVAVILVTSAVATPSFIKAYQYYQVSDAANRMANVIKYTRYEAIRRNTPVNYVIGPRAPFGTIVWTDSDGNGVADNTERQMIFSGTVNLVAPGGVNGPNHAGLIVAANLGPLVPLSNTNAIVQFDQRGAVNPPPAGAMVSYVGYPGETGAGYRAVILLPSGSMQLWKSDVSGTWTFLH